MKDEAFEHWNCTAAGQLEKAAGHGTQSGLLAQAIVTTHPLQQVVLTRKHFAQR
jgi:hypothetical protein